MNTLKDMKQYYVGDLCYVFDDKTWDEIWPQISDVGAWYTLKDGRRFFIGATNQGDGCWTGSDGNEYAADAGCLGCVAVEDVQDEDSYRKFIKDKANPEWRDYAHIKQVLGEPSCASEFGDFTLAGITIDTSDYSRYFA